MDPTPPETWLFHLGSSIGAVLLIIGGAMAYVLREIGMLRADAAHNVEALGQSMATDVATLRATDMAIQREMVRREEVDSLRADVRAMGLEIRSNFGSLGDRVDQVLLRLK